MVKFKFDDGHLLEMLADGLSTKEIAHIMGKTQSTIETYRVRLLRKYDAKNSAELIRMQYDLKLANLKLICCQAREVFLTQRHLGIQFSEDMNRTINLFLEHTKPLNGNESKDNKNSKA